MKIALLSCFHPYRGGISQFNSCLFRELGREHDVRAFNFKRQYPGLLFPGRSQYAEEGDPVEAERVLDSINPISYGRTVRAIQAWGPDLVITRYWMPFFAPSLGYVTRRLRRTCKVVSILDNVVPHERRFFDVPLTKYFLEGSDGYVVMCSAVGDDLLQLKPDAKFTVLHHPLYTHFGEPLPREEAENRLGLAHGKRNLLFFGLIREYKGLDILLEAFAELGDDYQLVVAGEPYGSFEKYQKIIDGMTLGDKGGADGPVPKNGTAEAGAGNTVGGNGPIGNSGGNGRVKLHLEYINDSGVNLYFSAADLCVLPYRSATQSGISSVSFHFGVPLLVTDVGGLKETIGDKGTGIVAKECSAECIREEIERYFSDPAIGASCKRHIGEEKERLSWKNFCANLLDFAQTVKKV